MWFLSLSQNILLLCTHPSSGASLIAQLVKNPLAMQETRPWFDSWVRKIPWRRDRPPTPVFLGFPCGSAVKDPPTVQETWVGKIPWKRDRPPTPVFLGFLGGSAGKEFTCNAGELGSIPGLGRSPGKGKSYPLQCSGQNSTDCIVHGIAKGRTRLSDFHFSHVSCLIITHYSKKRTFEYTVDP